jgi:hypothetical protein
MKNKNAHWRTPPKILRIEMELYVKCIYIYNINIFKNFEM